MHIDSHNMEPELQIAIYFENHILEFQKNLKTILDVDYAFFYQRVKSQIEICCILGCAKMKKILNALCKIKSYVELGLLMHFPNAYTVM